MSKQDVVQKWERIAWAACQASEEAGEPVRLVSVFARFGGYEVQVEVPRVALSEVRGDIKSAGGAMVAVFA